MYLSHQNNQSLTEISSYGNNQIPHFGDRNRTSTSTEIAFSNTRLSLALSENAPLKLIYDPSDIGSYRCCDVIWETDSGTYFNKY